jgi:hypothetical protein
MKPGSDIACGCASSLTVAGPCVSRPMTSRRVASDSAQNTWSRTAASAAMRYIAAGCSSETRFFSVS